MKRWGTIFTPILSGLAATLFLWTTAARGEKVCLIKVDGAIGPATASYISRAIDEAAADGAQCLIIQLDTPGGLLDSTKIIVQKFLASPVPTVVYVAPAGRGREARAVSSPLRPTSRRWRRPPASARPIRFPSAAVAAKKK